MSVAAWVGSIGGAVVAVGVVAAGVSQINELKARVAQVQRELPDLTPMEGRVATLEQGADAVFTQLQENVEGLRTQLTALRDKVSNIRLDCKTEIIDSPSSNNFQTSIQTPDKYKLVGGSCHFDEWEPGDNAILIQVGPGNNSGKAWSCFAKQSRKVPFTTTATFCRIAMD